MRSPSSMPDSRRLRAMRESYNLLCRSYFVLGNWDRAISACEKAVGLDAGNSRDHLWLGRAYGEKAADANFFTAHHARPESPLRI